ncbi:MAG TPA: hypothetical protein VN784_04615 [Candidatus Limnocylindrales bacterium]|nr:hypothetical protein [Candidatus Limnocylindrales bacterium]
MSANTLPVARFRLGHIVSTPNALSQLTQEDILMGIRRHQAGDWGDLDTRDKAANDRALLERTRIFSVYHSAAGAKFWLITEAGREATTVLMPEDY